jgi:hypothetical protein
LQLHLSLEHDRCCCCNTAPSIGYAGLGLIVWDIVSFGVLNSMVHEKNLGGGSAFFDDLSCWDTLRFGYATVSGL